MTIVQLVAAIRRIAFSAREPADALRRIRDLFREYDERARS